MWIKVRKTFRWLVVPALLAYVVKNIFVGADIDESYGVMVGYRLATGDRLLLEMWEPHQTSAIFTALLMKPFLWLADGKTEFLEIYLRVVYFLIQTVIAGLLCKTLKTCVRGFSGEKAFWMALVFFAVSPKSVYIPEYTNLHIWFMTLLVICLLWYYEEISPVHGRWWVLFLAGVCLTGDVLSYPGMVLLLPVCLWTIWKNHIHSIPKEGAVFVIPCVTGALLLTGYILSYMSLEQVFTVVPYVLGDGSHKISFWEKMVMWLRDFGEMGLVVAASLLISVVGSILYGGLKNEKRGKREIYGIFIFFGTQVIYQFGAWIFGRYNAAQSLKIYMGLVLIGIYTYYRGGKKEKTGGWMLLFSLVSYAGVLLMSNWRPVLLLVYLIIGALGGLMCWNTYLREQDMDLGRRTLEILCAILFFGNVFGYCFLAIGGEESHSTLLDVGGIYKSDFRKGIFATYMSAYRYNVNKEQWADAVPEGSTVLYVGPSQFFCMLGECTIASPNTISTPTYDESLLAYWEMNPERYPDVIVVESWYGDIRIEEECEFIMNWIENEFDAASVEDYSYVRVYRKSS